MKSIFFIFVLIVSANANVNVVCKAGIMDNSSAKIYINKLLKKEPENIECILKLANIHLKSGELLKGYKLITRAYNTNPLAVGQSDISNILPYALKMAKLAKNAKKNSDELLWNEVGDNFFDMGVYSESSKAYEKSLILSSEQSEIGLKLALSYKKSNQINNAVEQLFTLVEQNEKNFYANYYLGKILRYSITDEDSAVKYFTNAKDILFSKKDDFTSIEFTSFMNDINMELGK
jgi:tetratricopeptide (TPR) repeat protein